MSKLEEPSKENQTRTTQGKTLRRIKMVSWLIKILFQILRVAAFIFDIPFIDKGGSGSLDNYCTLRMNLSGKKPLRAKSIPSF